MGIDGVAMRRKSLLPLVVVAGIVVGRWSLAKIP